MARLHFAFLFCAVLAAGSRQISGAEESAFACIGPTGGGTTFGPAISPHDFNLLFVSCDMGGFYVSEDGGGQWQVCMLDNMRASRPH